MVNHMVMFVAVVIHQKTKKVHGGNNLPFHLYHLHTLFSTLLRFCPTDFLTALTGSTSTANVCLYVENCPTATSGALWKTRRICLLSYKACPRGLDQQTEGHTGDGAESKGEQ